MTLKLTLSEDWTDRVNRFSACLYKFRKAKSLIRWFLGGCGQKWKWPFISRGTLKSIQSYNEFMDWADFLIADSDAIVFGETDILLVDF